MKLQKFLILSIILFAQISFGASIEKVKGKKILINLEGIAVQEGEEIIARNPETNKKSAILKVSRVKGDKAIAEIVKGKVKVNYTIESSGAKMSEMPTSRKTTKREKFHDSGIAFGGLLGLNANTMELNLRDTNNAFIESIEQTGIGLGLYGAADMKLADWFSLRAIAGFDQFNVKADATNGASACTSCDTKITYFTGTLWGRAHLLSTVWLGLGLGMQAPMSIDTNALDKESIKSAAIFGIGGGADIPINDMWYVPIQAEYMMQREAEDVKTSFYGVRIGVMLRY